MGVANRIDPRKCPFREMLVEGQSAKYLRLENIALYGNIALWSSTPEMFTHCTYMYTLALNT